MGRVGGKENLKMASRASGKRGSSNGGNAVVGEGKGSVGRGTAGGDLPRETLEATGVDVDDGVGGDWGDSGRVGDCGRSWRGGRASSKEAFLKENNIY